VCHLIQYDVTSVSALHRQLLTPLQTQRPLRIDGHEIPGIPAIQRFTVYQSAQPFAALRLPDGSRPLDHAPDTVGFLFERGLVAGVTPYDPAVMLPRLRALLQSRHEAVTTREPASRVETPQPRVGSSVSKTATTPRREGDHPLLWLYYVMCGYAALGNTVFTGLMRWVELGAQPTGLRAFLRTDAGALMWPMLASMLLGLGLLGIYYALQLGSRSRWWLTALNSSLLAVLLYANLVNLFQIAFGAPIPSTVLLIYAIPYSLLLGVVAVITFTFASPLSSLPGTRGHQDALQPLWHQHRGVVAAAAMLGLGGVTAYSQLSSAYRLAYPLWFGYLFGGVVLWGVLQHYQRRRVNLPTERQASRSRNIGIDHLALPSLPPIDAFDVEAVALPALPSLDRS
jgi:hypothetical protein